MSVSPRIAVDTSAAVPLLVAAHTAHAEVRDWAHGRDLVLSGHALVETYSVLTRLPADARLRPDDAIELIDERFGAPVGLPPEVQVEAHRILAAAGIAGGAVYDGLVALAAREAGLALATRDARARPAYEALGVMVEIVTGR